MKLLINCPSDTDTIVRLNAAAALADIGDSLALWPLVNAPNGQESYVQTNAAAAMEYLADQQADRTLLAKLKDTRASIELIQNVAWAVSQI